ncbi:hypothetical protein RJ641_003897 [Dillenia turbinata]|uniref:Uncharacterized protein n=1 Tax=Dillenia turbinata TaxID=194707 RepID=A0AAN8VLG3_9MAGN
MTSFPKKRLDGTSLLEHFKLSTSTSMASEKSRMLCLPLLNYHAHKTNKNTRNLEAKVKYSIYPIIRSKEKAHIGKTESCTSMRILDQPRIPHPCRIPRTSMRSRSRLGRKMSKMGELDLGRLMDAERSEELKAFDSTKSGVKGLLAEEHNFQQSCLQVPVIDLEGIHKTNRHVGIVNEISTTSETWSFFPGWDPLNPQLLNGGTSISMLARDHLDHKDLPPMCRKAMLEYINHFTNYCLTLLGLNLVTSEAWNCDKGHLFVCQYYPAGPQPN